jgi:hypothetical protein
MMGIDQPDLTGHIRVYMDGKFRNQSPPIGRTVSLTAVPSGGFNASDRAHWMDISVSEWSPARYAWRSSTQSLSGSEFTLSRLKAGAYYRIRVDGNISTHIWSNNACQAENICQVDRKGRLAFSYYGPWGEREFSLESAGTRSKGSISAVKQPSRK